MANKRSDNSDFLATIWIMQASRGIILALVALMIPVVTPIEFQFDSYYLQVSGIILAVAGLQSLSNYVMTKRMLIAEFRYSTCLWK